MFHILWEVVPKRKKCLLKINLSLPYVSMCVCAYEPSFLLANIYSSHFHFISIIFCCDMYSNITSVYFLRWGYNIQQNLLLDETSLSINKIRKMTSTSGVGREWGMLHFTHSRELIYELGMSTWINKAIAMMPSHWLKWM